MLSATGVAIVLITKDRKSILLQLRDNLPNIASPNTWSIPGGAVEDGESSLEAVIREMAEETGYELGNPQLVATIETVSERTGQPRLKDIFWEEYDGHQTIECYEGQLMEFRKLSELNNLPLSNTMRASLYLLEEIASLPSTELSA